MLEVNAISLLEFESKRRCIETTGYQCSSSRSYININMSKLTFLARALLNRAFTLSGWSLSASVVSCMASSSFNFLKKKRSK